MYLKILLLNVVTVSLVFSSPSHSERLSQSSGLHNRTVGSFCFIDADCPMTHMTCQNNFCDCQDGFTAVVESDDIARCHVNTNLECPSLSARCTDVNAECTSEPFETPSGWWTQLRFCRCKPGLIYNPTIDLCQIVAGQPCQTDIPCVTANCNQATGLCSCTGFLVPSTDQLSCGTALGANCGSVTCADANSACSSVCNCNHGFQPSQKSSETYQICRKRFGAGCKEDPECADEYMECGAYGKGPATEDTHACLCQSGYVPNAGRISCLSQQGVMGGPCSVSNQCTSTFGRHAVCTNSVCACAAGYSYDWQSTSCVRN